MEVLTKYAIPFALAAVGTVLLLGLWNMMRGGQPKYQPAPDALARRVAVYRALPGHGGRLFGWASVGFVVTKA